MSMQPFVFEYSSKEEYKANQACKALRLEEVVSVNKQGEVTIYCPDHPGYYENSLTSDENPYNKGFQLAHELMYEAMGFVMSRDTLANLHKFKKIYEGSVNQNHSIFAYFPLEGLELSTRYPCIRLSAQDECDKLLFAWR